MPKTSKAHEKIQAEPPPRRPSAIAQVPAPIQTDEAAVVEVLKIETPKGGVFYVRKMDWENRADKADVPLCDVAGRPALTGQRAKLRASSISASKLTPVVVSVTAPESTPVDASEYLPPPANEASENVTL